MSKEKKTPLLSKSTLIIRLVAGGYLIYLAYELFTGLQAEGGAPMMVSVISAIAFLICGLVLVILNGKDFLKGNYQGGQMDIPFNENEKETEINYNLEDKIDEN